MRVDGRKCDELRPVKVTPEYLATAEGSVLIEFGNTKVVCAATVDDSVPQWLRGSGKGWVTAEYSMLPRSTQTRTAREITKGRPSGRTQEIQRLIGRCLRAVVDLRALGERTVILDCDVLQADGGTRTASITGAFLAMTMAFGKLVAYRRLAALPVRDYMGAVSVGIVGGDPMLDLCYEEDSRASVDMNVVMTAEGGFIELQATAEQKPFADEHLADMLALGRKGIGELVALEKQVVQL
jgi:ribonuclease PH